MIKQELGGGGVCMMNQASKRGWLLWLLSRGAGGVNLQAGVQRATGGAGGDCKRA